MKKQRNLHLTTLRHHAKSIIIPAVIFIFLLIFFKPVSAKGRDNSCQKGPLAQLTELDEHLPIENRVTDVGNIWMNFTNYGMWGNKWIGASYSFSDPCTMEWAPQAEFPAGSGTQYLWHADLWIGALVTEEGSETPRVSTGSDGWHFYPSEFSASSGIEERSIRQNAYNCLSELVTSEEARSEQDFITSYADTSTTWIDDEDIVDPVDGIHQPLGIEVNQSAYSWSYDTINNFIIVDYTVTNIGENQLKNVYIGLLVDNDVGDYEEASNFTDDTGGFVHEGLMNVPGQNDPVPVRFDAAWAADGDGRPAMVGSGNDFSSPGVFAVLPLNVSNPQLRTSYNWWTSNNESSMDFGPAWQDDGSEEDWTETYGTPEGDAKKYFLMGNREFDFEYYHLDDTNWISNNPQQLPVNNGQPETHDWRTSSIPSIADDIANGWDTRFLMSWGPVGVFDYIDPYGNRVYRLNPGESFTISLAFVIADDFHDVNNPQVSNTVIDPDKYDFAELFRSMFWAKNVYDNPMVDTDNPEGTLADGWYGEDTGLDGLYAENVGDLVEFIDMFGNQVSQTYPGPDQGERDGILQPEEDENTMRPDVAANTYMNGQFDPGDSYEDLRGPQPPPPPTVTHIFDGDDVIIEWEQNQNYRDVFLGMNDFEGFRIYISESGNINEYSFLTEYDVVDYAYFDMNDNMRTIPIVTDNPDTLDATIQLNGETLYLQPVGPNIGLDFIAYSEGVYRYTIENIGPTVNFVAVTATDFGNPIYGLEPMESSRSDSFIEVGVSRVEEKHGLPIAYSINSIYPNPFNPSTMIKIGLPNNANLKVAVFNLLGQNVATLASGDFRAGYHTFNFNAQNLSSGIYYVQAFVPGELNQVKKILLVK